MFRPWGGVMQKNMILSAALSFLYLQNARSARIGIVRLEKAGYGPLKSISQAFSHDPSTEQTAPPTSPA